MPRTGIPTSPGAPGRAAPLGLEPASAPGHRCAPRTATVTGTGSRGCAGPLAPESPLAPGHRAVQHLRGTGPCSTAGADPGPGAPGCAAPVHRTPGVQTGPPSAAHPPLHPGLPPPPVPLRPCAEPRPRPVLTPGAPGGAAGLGSERPWGRSRRRRRFHPGPARPRYCWEAAAAAPPSRRGRGGAGMEPPPPPVRGSASGSPGEPALGPPRAAAPAHRGSPPGEEAPGIPPRHRAAPEGRGRARRDPRRASRTLRRDCPKPGDPSGIPPGLQTRSRAVTRGRGLHPPPLEGEVWGFGVHTGPRVPGSPGPHGSAAGSGGARQNEEERRGQEEGLGVMRGTRRGSGGDGGTRTRSRGHRLSPSPAARGVNPRGSLRSPLCLRCPWAPRLLPAQEAAPGPAAPAASRGEVRLCLEGKSSPRPPQAPGGDSRGGPDRWTARPSPPPAWGPAGAARGSLWGGGHGSDTARPPRARVPSPAPPSHSVPAAPGTVGTRRGDTARAQTAAQDMPAWL